MTGSKGKLDEGNAVFHEQGNHAARSDANFGQGLGNMERGLMKTLVTHDHARKTKGWTLRGADRMIANEARKVDHSVPPDLLLTE